MHDSIHVQSRRLSAITQYVDGMWMQKVIASMVRPSFTISRSAFAEIVVASPGHSLGA
jgi:hypothetical protein